MAKTATLVIKNIAALYLCDPNFTIYHNAFLAARHDRIIAYGQGDYLALIDHATCVIDARGLIVIPAFIDGLFDLDPEQKDLWLEKRRVLHFMKSNGILTLLSRYPVLQQLNVMQQVYVRKHESFFPVVSGLQEASELTGQPFIISCQYGQIPQHIYSFQAIAYELYNNTDLTASEILQAMTSRPADMFGLAEQGSLETDKICDLLIVQAQSIEEYFSIMGMNPILYMIKRGILIYPRLMYV